MRASPVVRHHRIRNGKMKVQFAESVNLKVFSSEPEGDSIVSRSDFFFFFSGKLHASPIARNSAFSVHSTSFSPNPLQYFNSEVMCDKFEQKIKL